LRLSGSANQTLEGNGLYSLYDFTIANGANTINVNNDLIINNTLHLNGGPLDNSGSLLTVGSSDDEPGTIVYTSGVITGKLKSYFPNTTSSKLFPIGTLSKVRDVLIDFNITSPGVNQSLTLEFITGTPVSGSGATITGLPLTVSGQDINALSTSGYWEIIPTNGDYTSSICSKPYSMTVHANGMSDITNITTTRILKSAGSNSAALNHTEWTGLNAVSITVI
jgi:hypothetical protein